ncbi:hypothetical protein GY45DRAFT_1435894 [Cubamyces sp. BRFM 1775]|nr:hypothetical protein GY45DRAFT_1435894 [Cubamyces sp. BRFM 1775]
MGLLQLPQELVIHILCKLDDISDLLMCRLICHDLDSVFDAPVLRYRIRLAKAGMKPGFASDIPLVDCMRALEEYQATWCSLPLSGDDYYAAPYEDSPHLRFYGDALPLIRGTRLKIIKPPCAIRGVHSGTWSVDIAAFGPTFRVQRCAIDSSQNLAVICGTAATSQECSQCHLIALSGTSSPSPSYHPEAAEPVLIMSDYPKSLEVLIHGDLLGWMLWWHKKHVLNIYNWRTGVLLWQCAFNTYPTSFVFLDETKLVMIQAGLLRMYDIGHHTSTTQTTQTLTPPLLCTLALPPMAQRVSRSILTLKCQRPPPTDGSSTISERDRRFTAFTILFTLPSATRTSSETYLLVISVATLLRCVNTALGGSPSLSNATGPPPVIPWDVWGAPRSCLFRIHEPEDDTRTAYCLSAFGSTCAFAICNANHPASQDVFVFDFHPLAGLNSEKDDDREILARYIDDQPVVQGPAGRLCEPVCNTLPYQVVYKRATYSDDMGISMGHRSIALLEDGLLVVNTMVGWPGDSGCATRGRKGADESIAGFRIRACLQSRCAFIVP